MIQHDCFTTRIVVQRGLPYIEQEGSTILYLPKSKWYHLCNPIVMRADPFLFVKDDRLYLFYEQMGFSHGAGQIMMMFTDDLHNWSKPVPITNEPSCHFSYPWVFEDEGNVYLMPETGAQHNIRLYKAHDSNLSDFRLHKIILERPEVDRKGLKFDYSDSCICKKDSVYYLFTSYLKDNKYYLELYTSDSLDGKYTPHPMSPVCESNKFGRCGGSIIHDGVRLYRVAQDCEKEYGGQVHILEIETLTPISYKEEILKENVLPKNIYREGGHQLNLTLFNGNVVVATDVKYHCSFFLERVRLKLCKLLGIK